MARPTTRILAVLELLQAHGRLSGSEIARRLAVDRRTVRRYIAGLEELGIPITAERGRDGAYSLVAGFKLPPMLFSETEALALVVGLRAARSLGLAEAAPAVESAQAKLERVLPQSVRQRMRAVGESVQLDLARPAPPASNAALSALAAACEARQRVHLVYAARGGAGSERQLDPYGLCYLGGCWYVLGHCHLRRGLRTFRLDRVQAVEPLAARFERPADFDGLAILKRSLASLPRRHAIAVTLATDLDTARRELPFALGLLEPGAGGVLLRSQADDLGWFARELARLPFAFAVVGPPALAAELAAHARALLALSARGPGPSATVPARRPRP